MRRLVSLALVCCWLHFGTAATLAQQSADPLHIDDFGPVADFSLIDQNGRKVSRDDLKGKVWVASFFFSTCPVCPAAHMPNLARLHQELKGETDIVIVSFSVNPAVDTPQKLTAVADSFSARPKNWLFLTGTDTQAIYQLIRESFAQPANINREYLELIGLGSAPFQPAPLQVSFAVTAHELTSTGQQRSDIDHSFRFVIVDHHGNIRGYVDGNDPATVEPLVQRVKELVRAKYFPLPANYYPTINASLNGTCAILLVIGFIAIKRRRIGLHKFCMLAAITVSASFLACYLYYHIAVMEGRPSRFPGAGPERIVFLLILFSHTLLAIAVVPLVLFTTYWALRDNLKRHVTIARWTLPIWIYVSVTGVIVYWMLYHLYAPA
jgi:protein SCO1/2